MPKQGWVAANLNELSEGGLRGEGAHFLATASFELHPFDNGVSLVFNTELVNLDDPDGAYFNPGLSIGSDTLWDFGGLQVYRRDADVGLQENCNFQKYWRIPLLEAAKGTEFEKDVNQMLESGDFSPLSEFEFIARVIPHLDKDGKVIKNKPNKEGKTYPRVQYAPNKIVKLAGIKKASKAKPGAKPVTAAATTTKVATDDLEKIAEMLCGLVGKPALVCRTNLKLAGYDPDIMKSSETLGDLGFKLVSGKLTAL